MSDDATLYARMLTGMETFFGLAGDTSPGGFTIRRGRLVASVCPEMQHRSVFNSVVHRSAPGSRRRSMSSPASIRKPA